MKYTIEGFDQQTLIDYGLNGTDAIILRYIVDFWNSGTMVKLINDNKEYIWIKYQNVIESLPCIEIKSKIALARRFKKYEDCGLMEHYTHKTGGTFSCYRFTEKYTPLTQKLNPLTQKLYGVKPKSKDPFNSKVKAKDSSINNSSINKLLMSIIDKIYKAYPSKCVVSGRPTGKSQKCKAKIKTLLKNGNDELLKTTIRYVKECKENKTWLMNFKTFLNNLPDYTEQEQEEEDDHYGMCKEEIEYHEEQRRKSEAS